MTTRGPSPLPGVEMTTRGVSPLPIATHTGTVPAAHWK